MSSDDNTLHVRVRIERKRRARSAEKPDFVVDVDLHARPGATILFGPSGSGKTTILSAIAGLLRPQAGVIALGDDIWFDDQQRLDVPPHRRHVAYVFQSLALFPHMTALANAAYGVDRDVPRAQRRERGRSLLDRLGVGHLAERKPHTFSGGEAQRVALARALARSPKVLLLDEPFSALDYALRAQLVDLVRDLVAEYRVPLIHVTHHLDEARSLGDTVVRLADGHVTAIGAAEEVLADEPARTERTP